MDAVGWKDSRAYRLQAHTLRPWVGQEKCYAIRAVFHAGGAHSGKSPTQQCRTAQHAASLV